MLAYSFTYTNCINHSHNFLPNVGLFTKEGLNLTKDLRLVWQMITAAWPGFLENKILWTEPEEHGFEQDVLNRDEQYAQIGQDYDCQYVSNSQPQETGNGPPHTVRH